MSHLNTVRKASFVPFDFQYIRYCIAAKRADKLSEEDTQLDMDIAHRHHRYFPVEPYLSPVEVQKKD